MCFVSACWFVCMWWRYPRAPSFPLAYVHSFFFLFLCLTCSHFFPYIPPHHSPLYPSFKTGRGGAGRGRGRLGGGRGGRGKRNEREGGSVEITSRGKNAQKKSDTVSYSHSSLFFPSHRISSSFNRVRAWWRGGSG